MISSRNNVFISTKILKTGQSKTDDFYLSEFVKKELENKGFNVFLSEHHNMAGTVWKQTLEKQLIQADFFVFVSSNQEYFLDSEPIRFELSTFFNLMKTNSDKKFYRLNSKSFNIKSLKTTFAQYKNSNISSHADIKTLDNDLIDQIDTYDNISFEFSKNTKSIANNLDINPSITSALEKLYDSLQSVRDPNKISDNQNDSKLKILIRKLKNYSNLLTSYKIEGLEDLSDIDLREKYLEKFNKIKLETLSDSIDKAIELYKQIKDLGYNVDLIKPIGAPTLIEFTDFKDTLKAVLEGNIRHFDKWFLTKKQLLKYTIKKYKYDIDVTEKNLIYLYIKEEKNHIIKISGTKGLSKDSDASKWEFKQTNKIIFFYKYSFNDYNILES
jgi:hypothetical protein